jgi:hypothetical protein
VRNECGDSFCVIMDVIAVKGNAVYDIDHAVQSALVIGISYLIA